jgi:hypothetical protein
VFFNLESYEPPSKQEKPDKEEKPERMETESDIDDDIKQVNFFKPLL